MATRLLNSAIMPVPGDYSLREITSSDFADAVRTTEATGNLVSYIGYEQTAQFITALTGVAIPISREACALEDGDTLLICRLRYRVANPATKGVPVSEDDFEFFVSSYRSPEVSHVQT